jgi:hypothetical protein
MKPLGVCVLLILTCASSARAQDSPDIPFRISLVAAIAAHGADLATTEYCLGAKRCTEVNPWLTRFSTQPGVFGATKMGIAALSLWAVAKVRESHRPLAIIINFGMAAGFTAIAIHNTRETNKGTP